MSFSVTAQWAVLVVIGVITMSDKPDWYKYLSEPKIPGKHSKADALALWIAIALIVAAVIFMMLALL